MSRLSPLVIAGIFATAPLPAAAQAPSPQATVDQKQARYQVGQMERMLEGAVEHGATIMRDRLQAIVPTALLLSENARVRGFRLDGYGVFFDVEVPSVEGTMAWSLRTLDQNDLGLKNALRALKSHVDAAGDPNLEQALKRVEIQLGPISDSAQQPAAAATAVGVAQTAPGADGTAGAPVDPILRDPEAAYRTEVRQALMDAMLDYSGPLGVAPEEWLTIAARRNDDRPRLAPADTDAHTMVIRISGADLTAFRAGRLSREDALKRMDVRLF